MQPKLLLFLATFLLGLLSHADGRTRAPAEVFRALESPGAITLYSINPNPQVFRWWFSRWFHDYRIIGQVPVADPVQRRQVIEVLRRAARGSDFDAKCAITPRHGVRLLSGSKTYDFVICFECSKMIVYSDNEGIAGLSISGSSQALDRILQEARIRIAP